MNRMKFRKREVRHKEEKIRTSPFFDFSVQIQGEYETDYIEIVKRNRSFRDSVPIHLATTILQNSKLTILNTVYNMMTYWDTDAFDIVYTGIIHTFIPFI